MTSKVKFNEKQNIETSSGVSNAGKVEIMNLLANNDMPLLPTTFDYSLVNNQGKFAKRVSKHYFKEHGVKLDSKVVQQIGNLANMHKEEAEVHHIDFTNCLDWQAGEFGDNGSCFWTYNSGAKLMIEDADGFAIRFFNENGYGIARAWIIPFYDNYIVFNGYGKDTRSIASIFSKIVDMPVKQISFANNGSPYSTLYINSGRGYVLGDYPHDYLDLKLEDQEGEDQYRCDGCRHGIDEDYAHYTEDGIYCEYCFYDEFFYCPACGQGTSNDDSHVVGDCGFCEYCFDEIAVYCEKCENAVTIEDSYEFKDDHYCENCYCDVASSCENCSKDFDHDEMSEHDGTFYCQDCFDEILVSCEHCNESIKLSDAEKIDKSEYLCKDCQDKLHCEVCNCELDHNTIEDEVYTCDECIEDWETCPDCHKSMAQSYGELCPDCAIELHKINFLNGQYLDHYDYRLMPA